MPVIAIDAAAQHVGQEVTLRGWLRSRRDSGKLHFLTVRDGTGDMQAVVSKKAVGDEQFAISASLTQESSLIATGQLRQDERAPGGYELDVSRIEAGSHSATISFSPQKHRG